MQRKWYASGSKIINSSPRSHNGTAPLPVNVQRFINVQTTNLQSQSHPIKAVIDWVAKHFDVPTVSQVHTDQLVQVLFVLRLYTSDLMLDVTASSKGWQCQRKSLWALHEWEYSLCYAKTNPPKPRSSRQGNNITSSRWISNAGRRRRSGAPPQTPEHKQQSAHTHKEMRRRLWRWMQVCVEGRGAGKVWIEKARVERNFVYREERKDGWVRNAVWKVGELILIEHMASIQQRRKLFIVFHWSASCRRVSQ